MTKKNISLFLSNLVSFLVEHGGELLKVYPARAVLVELGEGRLALLLAEVGADLLELVARDEAVAVLVDGLKGQLGAGLVAAKLLKGHLAVEIAVALAEDLGDLGPRKKHIGLVMILCRIKREN